MEIYSIEVKEFKNTFYASLVVMVVFIVGSWLWVNNGVISLGFFGPLRGFSNPLIIGMMLLAIAYSSYRRKRLIAMQAIEDFQVRVKDYTRLYKLHNGWFVLSCFVSCFLYVVTKRSFFFYFAMFDLLLTLPIYPSRTLFKRELKNDELVIY